MGGQGRSRECYAANDMRSSDKNSTILNCTGVVDTSYFARPVLTRIRNKKMIFSLISTVTHDVTNNSTFLSPTPSRLPYSPPFPTPTPLLQIYTLKRTRLAIAKRAGIRSTVWAPHSPKQKGYIAV